MMNWLPSMPTGAINQIRQPAPKAARELIRYALNQRASCGDDVNAGGVAAQP